VKTELITSSLNENGF